MTWLGLLGIVAHYYFGPWMVVPFWKKGFWAILKEFGLRILGPWLGCVIILIRVICIFIQCEIFGSLTE